MGYEITPLPITPWGIYRFCNADAGDSIDKARKWKSVSRV